MKLLRFDRGDLQIETRDGNFKENLILKRLPARRRQPGGEER